MVKNVCGVGVQCGRSVYGDQAVGRMIRGLIARQGQGMSPPKTFLSGSGMHPASCLLGNGGSFPLGKHLGSEADGLLPSSDKVKNEWSPTSFHSVFIHNMHRDNFTFLV